MSPDRVLITGGGGQLASDLERLLAGVAAVAAPPRAELDVTDDDAVELAFREIRPQLVLNCAAFHNVELCEHAEEQAFATNAVAVKRLAERCAEQRAKLVHFSTNYVFDGVRPEPYAEHDRPSPRSVYAISKLAGEQAALAYAPDVLVVRSAGLYGLAGSASKGGNFVQRMAVRARDEGKVRMVADQRLNPTFTGDLAAATMKAVELDAAGILHLTSSGACSWFEFTRAILELAGIDAAVEPVETQRAPGGADRPLNGALARPAADAAGVPELPHWRDALAAYVEQAGLAPRPASAAQPG